MSRAWSFRILRLCPPVIGMIWVAGISRFRGYELSPREWMVLVAVAFALNLLTSLLGTRRPPPTLPAGSSPVTISLLAAGMLGVLASLIGIAFEAFVDQYRPSEVALPWRATWHAACVFGATYCGFLNRVAAAPRRSPPPA